jgi:hypothetical protein
MIRHLYGPVFSIASAGHSQVTDGEGPRCRLDGVNHEVPWKAHRTIKRTGFQQVNSAGAVAEAWFTVDPAIPL